MATSEKGFTAFAVHGLLDSLPPKVEAVVAHGSNIYLGSADGLIFLYRVSQSDGVYSASLEVKKQATTRKIEWMDVVPKLNHLLLLSGTDSICCHYPDVFR